MIFRLTVSVRSLDWWSQGSTMHTTTWETTMLMCSRRKLQTRYLFRLNQNWLPHSQIAENQPGTLLVTIDSKKLSANIESPSLIVQQHSDGILLTVSQDVLPDKHFCDNSGKWRPRDKSQVRLEHDEVTLACASALVHKKIYRSCLFVLHCLSLMLTFSTGTWWTLILIWMTFLW